MSEEKLPAVQGENKPALVPDSLVVFAQNPQQMREAQAQMVAWAARKRAETEVELTTLEANYEIAKKNKWRTSALKAAVNKTRRLVHFYDKTQKALEAGYCMVPNFPVGIFAIRTTRESPKSQDLKHWPNSVQDEDSNMPPAGEGRYVNSEIPVDTVVGPDEKGQERNFYTAGDEYADVAFPFTLVRPEIMEATSRAMALKIFDDVGCLPERRRKQRDPIIVGRLVHKDGYNERVFTFLIAWFMDLERM